MFQLKFLLHLAMIVLDWQIRRYSSNPNVYVWELLTGETIWLADCCVSRNNNCAFPNTISTCRNVTLRNEVVWTGGLTTLTVVQLIEKFPTFEVSSLRRLNSVRTFTYSFNRKLRNHYETYPRLSIPRIFPYSN
jgi:hypothetical protein